MTYSPNTASWRYFVDIPWGFVRVVGNGVLVLGKIWFSYFFTNCLCEFILVLEDSFHPHFPWGHLVHRMKYVGVWDRHRERERERIHNCDSCGVRNYFLQKMHLQMLHWLSHTGCLPLVGGGLQACPYRWVQQVNLKAMRRNSGYSMYITSLHRLFWNSEANVWFCLWRWWHGFPLSKCGGVQQGGYTSLHSPPQNSNLPQATTGGWDFGSMAHCHFLPTSSTVTFF